jgi:hypothetical protein
MFMDKSDIGTDTRKTQISLYISQLPCDKKLLKIGGYVKRKMST